MSLSVSLVLLIIVGFLIAFLTKKLNIVKYSNNPTQSGQRKFQGINFRPITILFVLILAAIFQPLNWEKIEVGYKGLLINLLGDRRGASNVKEVSGVVFYNKYTQEIQEIPLDQRNVKYEKMDLVAKGGYPILANPTFSANVKEQGAALMFTNLRTYYRNGGLEKVLEGWLFIQVNSVINGVVNKYGVEYFFNNIVAVEQEIQISMNKKVGNFFQIQSFKLNAIPPDNILISIRKKAQADADAITAEAQARVATADAKRKIELAKGDSASVVIRASASAKEIKLRQQELTPQYIDYIRATKWDGAYPSTMLGSGSNTLFNVK